MQAKLYEFKKKPFDEDQVEHFEIQKNVLNYKKKSFKFGFWNIWKHLQNFQTKI